MNRRTVQQSAVGVLAVLLLAACGHTPALQPSGVDLDQITFISVWTRSGTVRLTNGVYREPAAPDSAAELVIQKAGDIVYGELNGNASAAVVLVTNAGGSGTFFDLALLRWQSGSWINTDMAELGDRVQVHMVAIEDDTVRVDLTAHGPGDPMCCPSVRTERIFVLQNDRLSESGASNQPSSSSSIIGPVWRWQYSRYSDDSNSVPTDTGRYTLQLLPEGNIRIRADCNLAGGTYRLKDRQIAIEITHSTMAACPPGSLEQAYIRDLNAAAAYFIREKNLSIDLKFDSGTMAFRP